MQLFGRYIEVSIYTSDVQEGQLNEGALITINSKALHINFDVEKTTGDENNKGEVSVYNLSQDVIDLIKTSRPATLVLSAGYQDKDSINNIYTGEILEVKVDREGGDVKTTMTLATSLSSTRMLAKSKAWGNNTSLREVIDYVVTHISGATLRQPTRYKNHIWKRGVTISGNPLESLKKIVKNLGMVMTINDNEIDIYVAGQDLSFEVVVLNNNTGLVGIPDAIADVNEGQTIPDATQQSTDDPSQLNGDNKTIISDGYTVKSLLNSKLVPNARISLTSDKVKAENSLMTVDSVRHYGSNYENDFYSEITVYEDEV